MNLILSNGLPRITEQLIEKNHELYLIPVRFLSIPILSMLQIDSQQIQVEKYYMK